MGHCDRSSSETIFPTIPKAGMWPDAYYFSTREFAGGPLTFVGVGAYALDRAQAWPVILIRQWLGFWLRQARHTWSETACYRVILMGRHAAARKP